MNKILQKKMCNYLIRNGIENFVGVPDSTIKHFIAEGLRENRVIITTREEEAIGIATGLSLSKSLVVVFMQNAGFANCLSTITSLVQLYKIPLIFLIGWRGYLKTDAPEHAKIGKIQPGIIKLLGLESRTVKDEDWQECCDWAIKKIKKNIPCALIIRRIGDE